MRTFPRILPLHLPLLLLLLAPGFPGAGVTAAAAEPAAATATDPAAVEVFSGGLGQGFEFRAPMTVQHDRKKTPDREFLFWKGMELGAMFHTSLPPEEAEAEMKDFITEDITQKFKAAAVTCTEFKSGAGLKFHQFEAKVVSGGNNYVYCLVLQFDKRPGEDAIERELRKQCGTGKFELLIPEAEAEVVSSHLRRLLETYKPPGTIRR